MKRYKVSIGSGGVYLKCKAVEAKNIDAAMVQARAFLYMENVSTGVVFDCCKVDPITWRTPAPCTCAQDVMDRISRCRGEVAPVIGTPTGYCPWCGQKN